MCKEKLSSLYLEKGEPDKDSLFVCVCVGLVLVIASVRERGDGGDLARPRKRDANQDLGPETERDAGDTDHAPDLNHALAESTRTGTHTCPLCQRTRTQVHTQIHLIAVTTWTW